MYYELIETKRTFDPNVFTPGRLKLINYVAQGLQMFKKLERICASF